MKSINRLKILEWTIEITAYALILVFSYTALSKLFDFDTFKLQLSQSPITTKYASIIAVVVPFSELILALLLLFQKTRLIALYGSLLLMSSFTFYIYFMLYYSFYVPCSCGGIIQKLSWPQHLALNIVLTVLCAIAIFGQLYFRRKEVPMRLATV